MLPAAVFAWNMTHVPRMSVFFSSYATIAPLLSGQVYAMIKSALMFDLLPQANIFFKMLGFGSCAITGARPEAHRAYSAPVLYRVARRIPGGAASLVNSALFRLPPVSTGQRGRSLRRPLPHSAEILDGYTTWRAPSRDLASSGIRGQYFF